MKLSDRKQPKTIIEIIGQKHLKKKMKEYMEKPIEDIPNIYMIGINGTGKSSWGSMIAKRCLVDDDPGNLLHLNASDDRGINVIRGQVSAAAKHAPMMGGRRVIWFEEAHKLTDDAQEALKDIMEKYSHVLWIFTTNKPINIGLRDRCAEFHFRPISNKLIENEVRKVADEEFGEGVLSEVAIINIVIYSKGSMRKAYNLLESPPTLDSSKQLFTKACIDFEASVMMYQKSMMDTLSFLKQSSILVATSEKIKNVDFKKIICIEAANYAFMLAMMTPDDIVMRSFLAKINNEWNKK